jgi:hypothetical protein
MDVSIIIFLFLLSSEIRNILAFWYQFQKALRIMALFLGRLVGRRRLFTSPWYYGMLECHHGFL